MITFKLNFDFGHDRINLCGTLQIKTSLHYCWKKICKQIFLARPGGGWVELLKGYLACQVSLNLPLRPPRIFGLEFGPLSKKVGHPCFKGLYISLLAKSQKLVLLSVSACFRINSKIDEAYGTSQNIILIVKFSMK